MTKLQELQSRVLELEAENESLKSQLAAATTTATKGRQPSKARKEAEATLELLRKGPVTIAQLAAINSRYPSDCIYNVRRLFNVVIKTTKVKGAATTYELVGEVAPAPKPVAEDEPEANGTAAERS
jgi:cell division septum initiation protein DivIVA